MLKRTSNLALAVALGAGVSVGCGAAVPAASPSSAGGPAATATAPLATAFMPAASPTAFTPASTSPPPSAPAPTPRPTSNAATAAPSSASTPTPAGGDWIGPEKISDRGYGDISLVVDAAGTARAMAVLRGSVYHLTNASGRWTRERLAEATRSRDWITAYYDPTLAVDTDGSLAVAYLRRGGHVEDDFGPHPEAIHYTHNRSGQWSSPVVVGDGAGHDPSLAVRDGRFHVAYQLGHPVDLMDPSHRFPIRYATGDDGSMRDVLVAAHGTRPLLRVASDGSAYVLFGDGYGLLRRPRELMLATVDDAGSVVEEPVPGTIADAGFYNLELGADDRPTVTWMTTGTGMEEEAPVLHVQQLGSGSWPGFEIDIASLSMPGMARILATTVDPAGDVHAIISTATWSYDESGGTLADVGVYYVTNRGGTPRADRLPVDMAWTGDITIDSAGRAHLLFGTSADDESEPGLWYAVAPSD